MKKLYRSRENKIFSGIIGGIGEYFDVDPTVLRLIFVFLILASGIMPGIIAYIIALFIVPQKPEAK
jgi:phage shock protein C